MNDYKEVEAQFVGKKTQGEIDCQFMDYEKVNKYFGWSPQTSFEIGIRNTIAWYKKFLLETEGAPSNHDCDEYNG